jgi:hypothetical protein
MVDLFRDDDNGQKRQETGLSDSATKDLHQQQGGPGNLKTGGVHDNTPEKI